MSVKAGFGRFGDPNAGLLNVNGKYVWAIADGLQPTIIYDGVDMRQLVGLDGAHRPFTLQDKLIFVGLKDGKYSIYFNGQKLGPEFEEISITYCCEIALNSIRRYPGQYTFWGIREDRYYLVVISPTG